MAAIVLLFPASRSTAIGTDAIAGGSEPTSLGCGTQATQTESTALGERALASGIGAVAPGTNAATYRGEVGFSAGLMHRLEGDFAISAGVTYAGGDSTTFRAGVAGEF